MSLASIANNTTINYQKLQYFFTEAHWSTQELNDIRLRILQNQRTTQANKNGVLAIDDTACPKPYAEKTEGAQVQYCGALGKEENCNVAVASCFVSETKHFPVDFKSYLPITTPNPKNFKSKLDLAKELIDDALKKGVPFRYVLFDSWYSSSDVLSFIHDKNLKFISEIKSDRKVYFRNPEAKKSYFMQQDELVKLIRRHLWHKARVFKHRGEQLNV
jgi:SRSO17 transposase